MVNSHWIQWTLRQSALRCKRASFVRWLGRSATPSMRSIAYQREQAGWNAYKLAYETVNGTIGQFDHAPKTAWNESSYGSI